LPDFVDDVTGFDLVAPSGNLVQEPTEIPELPVHVPNYPGFPLSVVSVPIPASALIPFKGGPNVRLEDHDDVETHGFFNPHFDKCETAVHRVEKDVSFVRDNVSPGPRRSGRTKVKSVTPKEGAEVPDIPVPTRRQVKDRWYYEINGIEGSFVAPLALLSTDPSPTQNASSLSTESSDGNQGKILQSVGSSSGGFPGDSQRSDVLQTPGDDNRLPAEITETRARISIVLTLTFPDRERYDQRYSAHPR
jgi:hypothetical protein